MAEQEKSQDNCVECAVADEAAQTEQHYVVVPSKPQDEDIVNPSTFTPPDLSVGPAVTIEYCDRCRWAPRASWVATELFLTFPNPALSSITLMPSVENAGRFRVWLSLGRGTDSKLLWDRKVEGGFPELKILKQRVRDCIQPNQNLGHSDKAKHIAVASAH